MVAMLKKNNLVFLLLLVIGALCFRVYSSEGHTLKSKELDGSNIYITAAHVDVDSKDYTLLYKDEKRDVAYYLKTSPTQTEVALGSVSIEGLADAEIIESYPGYFIVKTNDKEHIVNGLSGTRVIRIGTGEEIGFVDALVEGGNIKCITLE